MSRTEIASRLDAAERDEAHARGRLAAIRGHKPGGPLEPKHKRPDLAEAWRQGHADESRAIAELAA